MNQNGSFRRAYLLDLPSFYQKVVVSRGKAFGCSPQRVKLLSRSKLDTVLLKQVKHHKAAEECSVRNIPLLLCDVLPVSIKQCPVLSGSGVSLAAASTQRLCLWTPLPFDKRRANLKDMPDENFRFDSQTIRLCAVGEWAMFCIWLKFGFAFIAPENVVSLHSPKD